MAKFESRYFIKNSSLLLSGTVFHTCIKEIFNDFGIESKFIDTPTADEYEKYVTDAIAFSKQIAKGDALLRQAGIFNKVVGEAQSYLSIISESASNFGLLINDLTDTSNLRKDDGSIDIKETLKQFFISTQLLSQYESVRRNLSNYTLTRSDFHNTATPDPSEYDVKNINFEFAKPEIELPDGVFIPLIGYDLVTIAASIIIDLFQVFVNMKEKEKIEAQARRLENEKVKNDEYWGYVKSGFNELYCPQMERSYEANKFNLQFRKFVCRRCDCRRKRNRLDDLLYCSRSNARI